MLILNLCGNVEFHNNIKEKDVEKNRGNFCISVFDYMSKFGENKNIAS